MARNVRSFRVDDDLWEWSKDYAEREHRRQISWLLVEMMEALRDGRMVIAPRPGPNAYPADELTVGDDHE